MIHIAAMKAKLGYRKTAGDEADALGTNEEKSEGGMDKRRVWLSQDQSSRFRSASNVRRFCSGRSG